MDRDLLADRLFDRMWREGRISRRNLLRAAMAVAASGLVVPAHAPRAQGRPIFAAYPFQLGVASGYPTPDGVTIWSRLAPAPLAKDGGMDVSEARRLRSLEEENNRLKRVVADQAVTIQILKEVNSKKW